MYLDKERIFRKVGTFVRVGGSKGCVDGFHQNVIGELDAFYVRVSERVKREIKTYVYAFRMALSAIHLLLRMRAAHRGNALLQRRMVIEEPT